MRSIQAQRYEELCLSNASFLSHAITGETLIRKNLINITKEVHHLKICGLENREYHKQQYLAN